ncbi:hypothetical protein TNCV_4170711 [Trichonephila clavipes]|nr:hypothetical protein TNCV_4170711 [Trichonephila clavipes]
MCENECPISHDGCSSSGWRSFLMVTFFRHLQWKKSRIDDSGERGGQSLLEMSRSPKNSVKTSILSRDMGSHYIEPLCTAVSTSVTFVSTMDAVPDRFLSATDLVSRNPCTKRVIVDAFRAASLEYFY